MKMSYHDLMKHVRYPASCRIAGNEGMVVVGFIVNKKGIPVNVHIVKGIGGSCDKAAIQAIRKYARFTPAMVNGKPVRMAKTIAISFRLVSF